MFKLSVFCQEAFGFIERADVVKEIFFHYSEFKGDLEALQAGDDVEFTIKDRNVSAMCPNFFLIVSTLGRSTIN